MKKTSRLFAILIPAAAMLLSACGSATDSVPDAEAWDRPAQPPVIAKPGVPDVPTVFALDCRKAYPGHTTFYYNVVVDPKSLQQTKMSGGTINQYSSSILQIQQMVQGTLKYLLKLPVSLQFIQKDDGQASAVVTSTADTIEYLNKLGQIDIHLNPALNPTTLASKPDFLVIQLQGLSSLSRSSAALYGLFPGDALECR